MALYRSPDKFESVGLLIQEKKFNNDLVPEKKFNTDFQDGGHFGFPIRTILATFDLQAISILPMKFESVALLVQKIKFKRFSTWLLGRPSWISNQNNFRYF